MKELKEMSLETKWYKCPVCKTKLFIFNETAHVGGIFIKCRTCKNEIKVEI